MLILCDFDGTITTEDVTNLMMDHFTGTGWRETDIGYAGPHDWTVVWPGVPGAKADQIVKDTQKLGYNVELELA